LREGWKKMPRIESSGKGRDRRWKRDAEDKSSRKGRDERWKKFEK